VARTRRIPYLNGARFGLFSADNVETNAIGRGITVLLSICVASLNPKVCIQTIKKCASEAYAVDVVAISHVFHPSSSSAFQSCPSGVSDSPSPTFQFLFGGSVNLKGCALANGANSTASLGEPEPKLMRDVGPVRVGDNRLMQVYIILTPRPAYE